MSNEHIVSSSGVIGLIGGAKVEVTEIKQLLPLITDIVAADGGADHLLAAGLIPAAVIGDMDSITDRAQRAFKDRLHRIGEQETTDFEKALTRIGAACVLALGFTGGRMDHALAVLNVLARHAHRSVVLLDGSDASFVAPQSPVRLDLPLGSRISLMPLADTVVTATGLRWPLNRAQMQPAGMTSASNAVAEQHVEISAQGPVLITLPRAHLAEVLRAIGADRA
ncbi:thiamine diphosphokinase [Yoonia sp.]|uniref:thiamine diphosphokinase n=1 Tax=Yoonia sp. TaxID=2212373 RepID=UPI0019DAE152|nr:thiamine diphosphokinase [Yoonia sp.]MBE0413242.1 thiamine diphosphokinase [Yoonia sp.]